MPWNLTLKEFKEKFNFRKMVIIANIYRTLDFMYTVVSSSYWPYVAISLKLQLNKTKKSVLQSTSHISKAGYCTEYRYSTFHHHTDLLLVNTDVY